MYAEKLIVTTDKFGNLQAMPKLPANQKFEAIFLVLENKKVIPKRCPNPDIAGSVKIMGDIINTQEDKLTILRSALIAGENSGVVENYSLANLLVELDSEALA